MRVALLALAVASSALGQEVLILPPAPGTGCSTDMDCKGARVCEAGSCVEAPAASAATVDETEQPRHLVGEICVAGGVLSLLQGSGPARPMVQLLGALGPSASGKVSFIGLGSLSFSFASTGALLMEAIGPGIRFGRGPVIFEAGIGLTLIHAFLANETITELGASALAKGSLVIFDGLALNLHAGVTLDNGALILALGAGVGYHWL